MKKSNKPAQHFSPLERYVWFNRDDRDLTAFKVKQFWIVQRTYEEMGLEPPAKPPPLKLMPNLNKEIDDQVFEREVIPQRLKDLEKGIRARKRLKKDTLVKFEIETIDMFWKELEDNPSKYRIELEWLKMQWNYRLFGKFFLVRGKITYITGAHWFFLNHWYLDTELPEYRDRDRRWFLGQQFAFIDNTTFADFDEEGNAKPNEKGEYDMINLGRRVCLGTINPKSRRVGDTSKAQCRNAEVAMRTIEAHIGIQGKDDDNARNVFNHHFMTPFKKLPIYFKPLTEQIDPRTEQVFNHEEFGKGLGTKVDFATSADRSAYDGYKLTAYHRDEPGKVKYEDINKSHKVVKECLTLGAGIKVIGFMMYTTTVDEMNNRGGERFFELVKEAMYHKRNTNGQTQSGLYTIFFRASDGMEGFVGKYGESVEFDPTPEQAAFTGKSYGALEHVMNNRKPFIQSGNYEGLAEEKRKFPIEFRECFIPPSQNVFFNMEALQETIVELKMNPVAIRGDFHWTNGFGSRVYWQEDRNGRWLMSKKLRENETNLFQRVNGVYVPRVPDRGIIGIDPHRLEKTGGDKMSDTGMAAFLDHDEQIDPSSGRDAKDVMEWETNRFILSYLYRADTIALMVEDALKAAVYTGFMVYPESNIDAIGSQFLEWGYGGFLLYDTDPKTGRLKPNAGWYTQDGTKKKLFNHIRDHMEVHAKREKHPDILQQCIDIKGLDDMTNNDLFAAAGGALLGRQSKQTQYMKGYTDRVNVSGVIKSKRY